MEADVALPLVGMMTSGGMTSVGLGVSTTTPVTDVIVGKVTEAATILALSLVAKPLLPEAPRKAERVEICVPRIGVDWKTLKATLRLERRAATALVIVT